MKRNKYLTTIQSLTQELSNFQKILKIVHNTSSPFLINQKSISYDIQKILSLIQEAEKFRCLTLISAHPRQRYGGSTTGAR
jgi:hypothetical protein